MRAGGNFGNFRYTVEIKSAELIAGAEAAQQETLRQLGGQYIRGESTAIAPLRDGSLIASSYVELVSNDKVEIGYRKIYANVQHEGVNFFHPNGRKAKYLQKVMEDPNTQAQAELLFGNNLQKHIGR